MSHHQLTWNSDSSFRRRVNMSSANSISSASLDDSEDSDDSDLHQQHSGDEDDNDTAFLSNGGGDSGHRHVNTKHSKSQEESLIRWGVVALIIAMGITGTLLTLFLQSGGGDSSSSSKEVTKQAVRCILAVFYCTHVYWLTVVHSFQFFQIANTLETAMKPYFYSTIPLAFSTLAEELIQASKNETSFELLSKTLTTTNADSIWLVTRSKTDNNVWMVTNGQSALPSTLPVPSGNTLVSPEQQVWLQQASQSSLMWTNESYRSLPGQNENDFDIHVRVIQPINDTMAIMGMLRIGSVILQWLPENSNTLAATVQGCNSSTYYRVEGKSVTEVKAALEEENVVSYTYNLTPPGLCQYQLVC